MLANTILWTLIGVYAALVLGTVAVVLSQNRNPLKSLSWVCVLILFPVFGLLLYFFFGQSIKNTHMVSRRNKRRLLETDKVNDLTSLPQQMSTDNRRMVKLINSLDHAHFYPLASDRDGNHLYNNGREFFKDLFRDIENAKSFINVQFYIIMDDQIGTRLAELLIKKAKEGVKVRMIYDYVGSYKVKKAFFKMLNEAGVEAHAFFRVIFPILATRINWRNHRKAVIIDGEIAYLGSMNVADRYLTGGDFAVWRDAGVRITGAPVNGVQRNFAIDWNFMGQPLILETGEIENKSESPVEEGIQLVTSGPTGKWSNIASVFFQAISSAKKRVFLQTPYFLPTEPLLQALQTAALSGVDVRVMIPRKSDSAMLTYASYSYIDECMSAGVKFYMFENGMLHSKVLVVDYDFATLGSANFDFRSFEHNFEENIVAYSSRINSELTTQFFADMKNCTRIKLNSWRKRPKGQKAKESILRLLSPLL